MSLLDAVARYFSRFVCLLQSCFIKMKCPTLTVTLLGIWNFASVTMLVVNLMVGKLSICKSFVQEV